MNLVLLFAACAPPCPTFEETEIVVEDPEGAGEFEQTVRWTVEWFAEATIREGVCVEEIAIVEEVTGKTEDGEVVQLGGSYSGFERRIELSVPRADPFRTTVHELCHALDDAEGIVEQHADLFPADAVGDFVPRAVRAHEAFAQACAAGDEDLGFETQMADTCGLVEVSERDRFLAEVVYPGLQRPVPELGPEAEWTFRELPLGRYAYVASTFSDGEIVVLVRAPVRGGRPDHALLRVDPVSGASRLETLPVSLDARWDYRFLDADEGLWIEAAYSGTGVFWDGKRWSPFDLGLDAGYLSAAAVHEGVLHGIHFGTSAGGLVRWDSKSRTLATVEGGPPAYAYPPYSTGWPVDGGVELANVSSLLRWVDGAWTETPLLQSPYGRAGLDGARRAFAYAARDYGGFLQELDVETGEATFRPICTPIHWRGAWISPDGTLLDLVTTEEGTTLRFGPLTW